MKLKIGDKVKLNPNIRDFKWGRGGVSYDEIGVIGEIYEDDYIFINFPSHSYWQGLEKELILINDIEVGDIVKINKNITLGDLPKDHWNGCQYDTMDFLKDISYDNFDNEYEVTEVTETHIMVKGYPQVINRIVFELVRKKEVKEMTIEQIIKELGYEVKIVKEEK